MNSLIELITHELGLLCMYIVAAINEYSCSGVCIEAAINEFINSNE